MNNKGNKRLRSVFRVLFLTPGNQRMIPERRGRQKGQFMKLCKMECLYAEDVEEKVTADRKEQELPFPEDYGEVRNLIFAKLINTSRNLELLEQVPSVSVLDLSLVYYLFRNHDPDSAEILVTGEMTDLWKVEEFDLFQDALSNTRNLLGHNIRPLKEMISELLKDVLPDVCLDSEESSFPMYVLTNYWKRNGAVCLLFDDVLSEFANRMNSDLYLIPSSIHELILVPVSENVKREDLDQIIREVNRNELLPEDVLSDHSYLFSRKIGRVLI